MGAGVGGGATIGAEVVGVGGGATGAMVGAGLGGGTGDALQVYCGESTRFSGIPCPSTSMNVIAPLSSWEST